MSDLWRRYRYAVGLTKCSIHNGVWAHRGEVAKQWTPVAKRMARLNVDVQLTVVHSVKDCHLEGKRLTTLAVWKPEKTVAEFYANWPADWRPADERPVLRTGERARADGRRVRPDDTAPWNWDLEPELFEAVRDWSGYLELLRD